MRITIIGAGAMGGLFGSLMTETGQDVQLVDIWEEHVRRIQKEGLRIESDGRVRNVRLDIYTDYHHTRPADLVIIFVKGPQTAAAAQAAAESVDPTGVVLTLQNGLGNADVLADAMDPQMVISGTTAYGSTVLGPGSIRHAGKGPTIVGPWAGCPIEKAHAAAHALTQATIETDVNEDVHALVWNKLLVNVGINAIVALTRITNGQLLDLEVTRRLSKAAVEEGMAVAAAMKIDVRDDAVEHCWWVAEQTGKTRASMGQDVDARRQTEIDTINGAIVRLGRQYGIETPVNFALTALVETRQHHYLQSE